MEVYKTILVPVFCAKVKFGVLTIGRCIDRGEFNSKSQRHRKTYENPSSLPANSLENHQRTHLKFVSKR